MPATKRKLARAYHSGPDKFGRYTYTDMHVDFASARADGPVMRAQVFFCVPMDRPRSKVREFSLRHSPHSIRTEADLDAAARAWLTEGIELTPTCVRCGMGETRHASGPHVHTFTPSN